MNNYLNKFLNSTASTVAAVNNISNNGNNYSTINSNTNDKKITDMIKKENIKEKAQRNLLKYMNDIEGLEQNKKKREKIKIEKEKGREQLHLWKERKEKEIKKQNGAIHNNTLQQTVTTIKHPFIKKSDCDIVNNNNYFTCQNNMISKQLNKLKRITNKEKELDDIYKKVQEKKKKNKEKRLKLEALWFDEIDKKKISNKWSKELTKMTIEENDLQYLENGQSKVFEVRYNYDRKNRINTAPSNLSNYHSSINGNYSGSLNVSNSISNVISNIGNDNGRAITNSNSSINGNDKYGTKENINNRSNGSNSNSSNNSLLLVEDNKIVGGNRQVSNHNNGLQHFKLDNNRRSVNSSLNSSISLNSLQEVARYHSPMSRK
ncbi:hypothetical protein ABK040_012577 [Willaertia magna]